MLVGQALGQVIPPALSNLAPTMMHGKGMTKPFLHRIKDQRE